MIQGRVNSALEAVLRLVIQGSSGRTQAIEAVVDTGYTGFLTLPPALVAELGLAFVSKGKGFLADGSAVSFDVYGAFLEWDDRRRYIRVDVTGGQAATGNAAT